MSINLSKKLEDFESKHKKDVEQPIDWVPSISRIKIKPDPETLSAIIDVKVSDAYGRGTILAVGKMVGMIDGFRAIQLKPGMRVIYNLKHVIKYTGADGVTHYFLRENSEINSIIAYEPIQEEEWN